jgi:peptidoglycan/xylan/chitin deacetylase (PgdA/CDA1 family)
LTVVALALSEYPAAQPDAFQRAEGGIVRGSTDTRQLAIVFTGHEFAEGAPAILDALAARRARASFFLTGTFLRDRGKADVVRRMVADGHYVGPHSDAHLLYAPWTGPKVTLVSRETFTIDRERNIEALTPFGGRDDAATLPPYEWAHGGDRRLTRAAGDAHLPHPGTRSNADTEGHAAVCRDRHHLRSILTRA